ncbi:hypothetical protein PR202_ga15410 [Eleusine coracana subsp. coracana]|uniref:DUF547 domain-containing protein n=1 Tax=Eleusine coracana subsp. coracana TaxID=191504 RepID=A0AAV5CJS7_ELECO|nr:hypothetical protein PR202_ga15410 [Eleusine coracana subsp. coracana]
MERKSRSGVLSETGSCAGTPRSVNSSCSLQHRYSSRSTLKTHEGALDMLPRFSYCKPKDNRESPEGNLKVQSIADLAGEIAALEQEVIRKELHLLSLYRRAFDQYLSESCSFTSEVDQETLKNMDEGALRLRDIKHSATFSLPTISNSEVSKPGSRHSSLVNFLSASISDYVPKISCKLSEDILSCIASVYCKLGRTPSQDADCMTSPSPSVSSASTFSPRHRNDSWSPRYNFDSPRQYGSQKERNEQNIGMIIVPRIRIDSDKFDYASKMLETIRTLIQRLEKIDPLKMAHEEQLCFWINIHNALVMHAFLAYGLHDKRMKSTDMILKVRLYTAKKIHHQLELARTEFIQANVMVRKQVLLLPKVLHYYAKDAALELRHLVELVSESMSEAQQLEAQRCLRRRVDKCVEWLPYKSSFRYVVHRDLAADD